MNAIEADDLVRRLRALWGGISDDGAGVWCEHLAPLDYETCRVGIHDLERTASRRPSIADVLEAYRAVRARTGADRHVEQRLEDGVPTYWCLDCQDTGWEHVDRPMITIGGNLAPGGVQRCPKGCKVPGYTTQPMPSHDERAASAAGMARIGAELKAAQLERERQANTMSEDDFVRAQGFDPRTHHRSRSGHVLRRIDPLTRQPLR